MIDEAGKAGVKLAAHAWTHQGAHNAATAGVASIEHGFAMTDDDLQIAKKNNVVLVGTEYLALPDAKSRPQWIDRLRRAYKIGVTMAPVEGSGSCPAWMQSVAKAMEGSFIG